MNALNPWIRKTALASVTALGMYLGGVALSGISEPNGDDLVGNTFDVSGVAQVGYTIKEPGQPAHKLHPLAFVEGTLEFGVTDPSGVGPCTFDGVLVGPGGVLNSTWKNHGDFGVADFKDAYQAAVSGKSDTTVKTCRFKNGRAQSSFGTYFAGTFQIKLTFQTSGLKGSLKGKIPVGGSLAGA